MAGRQKRALHRYLGLPDATAGTKTRHAMFDAALFAAENGESSADFDLLVRYGRSRGIGVTILERSVEELMVQALTRLEGAGSA